ncbi:22444_t:CDS:2 [Cetraspora pellucida]|uniref:22444_t:CDS:1 n=1 Tax=Cetraspora pellucida TaxID=1433469 RepID=A0A9N9BV27_9GLOM|nr:22444_t:CDS:2 [Cetraspora pellucida]
MHVDGTLVKIVRTTVLQKLRLRTFLPPRVSSPNIGLEPLPGIANPDLGFETLIKASNEKEINSDEKNTN